MEHAVVAGFVGLAVIVAADRLAAEDAGKHRGCFFAADCAEAGNSHSDHP